MARTKQKIMATRCLLLKTPDQRCFFTEEKHFPLLLEFGRTFEAEISIVKMKEEVEVQPLASLARLICSQQKSDYPAYEIIEVKLAANAAKSKIDRAERARRSKEINQYIREQLLNSTGVSISSLGTKFGESGQKYASETALARHLMRARRELEAAGHKVIRNKDSSYRVANNLKADYYES
jgi:hypothetical protein